MLKRHLARLKLEDFDSIIILADESLETDMQTADSRSLATLLLLRQQVKNVQVRVCLFSPPLPYLPCSMELQSHESYAMPNVEILVAG